MITITSLHTYPVKGLRGIDLRSATVRARGFAYDREWMIVDDNNKFVTQRNASVMATIEPEITSTHLVLRHESASPLHVELKHRTADAETVTVWRDQCEAVDQGSDAAAWLTKIMNGDNAGPVRLMRFAPRGLRPVEQDYLDGVSAEVGFADGYPFLVTNEATLDALNSRLDDVVPMNRFRPNIVIRGLPALDEHKLKALSVLKRDVTMLLPKPCQRCKVTTIDQQTGEVAETREPLRTLVRSHSLPDLVGGYFGQNGVPVQGLDTEIHIGDEIEVTYSQGIASCNR